MHEDRSECKSQEGGSLPSNMEKGGDSKWAEAYVSRLKRFDYFHEVCDPLTLIAMANPAPVQFFQIGSVQRYPILALRVEGSGRSGNKEILISGGVHGEEPAGVFAVRELVLEAAQGAFPHCNITFLPCINPIGFENGVRVGSEGKDLNRNFILETNECEARIVVEYLRRVGRRYAATLDLHEIDPEWGDEGFVAKDNPHTFYLYETQVDVGKRIGERMVRAGERIGPACKWGKIYDDINHGGVVWYPEGNGNSVYAQGTSLEAFLFTHYTDHSFTLETPCGWPLEQRVKLHCALVREALNGLSAER